MTAIWHFIVHIMGVDQGMPYGTWDWYNFHSGIAGSSFSAAAAAFIVIWWHSTCHDHLLCLRRGKYAAAGGTFKLCWKHHPDMGERPNSDLIRRLHREHQRRTAPPAQAVEPSRKLRAPGRR